MSDIVIVSGARTPMGGFQGSLSSVAAVDLGAAAIRAAVERGGDSFDRTRHAPGVRRREVIRKQATHGVFCCFAPAFMATDAVGDRCNNAFVFKLLAFGRGDGAKILVPLTRASE